MMRSCHRLSARAFTLMELLVCIGMIAMILSVSGVCFAQVIRLRGAHERYNNRVASAEFLLRRVARDVRESKGFVGTAGEFNAGEDCIILRGQNALVVYQVNENGVEFTRISSQETRSMMVMDNQTVRVRFGFEGVAPADARSVITTVEWEEHPRIGISRPVLSLRTACRTVRDPLSVSSSVKLVAEMEGGE